MPSHNPYAPPQSTTPTTLAQSIPEPSSRNIVLGWEKLRIIYNLALLFPGLAILFSINVPISGIISISLVFGILANLCYFFGPITELYTCALTHHAELPKLRMILFCVGLGGSLLLFLLIYLGITS